MAPPRWASDPALIWPCSSRGQGLRHRQYRTRLYHSDYFVIRHLSRFLESRLKQHICSGCRVGDVGCGEQPWRGRIETRGGVYTGIDIEQNSQDTVHLIADITQVPRPDGCFDAILCTEVLEHVPDTMAAFHELARLVRPGGKIILTTPFSYPMHEEPYDFVRLTPYQVQRCAQSSGLEVAELTLAGNELEVMATVWSNMWARALAGSKPGLLRKIRGVINRLMIFPVNLAALVASSVFSQALPGRYYLNVLCVLERSMEGQAEQLVE